MPSWLRIVTKLVDTYAEAQRAKYDQEKASYRAANWTAGATVAIAAFTAATIGVGIAQWHILSGTLNEMKAEQRPWIYADLSPGGKIFRNQSGGLTFPIGFTFHNDGHLPAFYVFPDIEAYLSGEDGKVGSTTARERQRIRCDRPLSKQSTIGITVFPSQKTGFGASVGITAEEIESAGKAYRAATGRNAEFIFPWVTGCIRYRSLDRIEHQTGIAFTIDNWKPGTFPVLALPVDPTIIDPGQIHISPWVEGGTAYAN